MEAYIFYVIYKITNQINGKFYIGKHQTEDLEDGYMGSGKLIQAAIAKYGIENFTKEYLGYFENERLLGIAERILVVLDEEVSYNLCPGGKGGWGYINENDLNPRFNRDFQKSISPFGTEEFIELNKEHFVRGGKNSRKGEKKWASFSGLSHSEETKRKMSESHKKRIRPKGYKRGPYKKRVK